MAYNTYNFPGKTGTNLGDGLKDTNSGTLYVRKKLQYFVISEEENEKLLIMRHTTYINVLSTLPVNIMFDRI